jgi:hypothetical protein
MLEHSWIKVVEDSRIYYESCVRAEQMKDNPSYQAQIRRVLEEMIGAIR